MHCSNSVAQLVIPMNQFPRAFLGLKTSHTIIPGALGLIMAEHSLHLDYALPCQVTNSAVDILLVTSNPSDSDCDCDGNGCDVCNAGGKPIKDPQALCRASEIHIGLRLGARTTDCELYS